jgi:hypothetical protein
MSLILVYTLVAALAFGALASLIFESASGRHCAAALRRPAVMEAPRRAPRSKTKKHPRQILPRLQPLANASSAGVMEYFTRGSWLPYRFSIEWRAGSGYRIYILDQPGARAYTPHKLFDAAGRPYVCWSAMIATIEDARKIAQLWAEHTQRYLSTGHWH